jgi:NAD-dependent dihydropyrimidine dehydrogenase PreA subunit
LNSENFYRRFMADIRGWKSEEWTIEIDYDKCVGAAECVEICPSDVFEIIAPNIDECIECCSCVEVCPEVAILHSSC